MIAHMTQIVDNDILVKELSAHGHSKCKRGTSSAKKKTQNNKLDCHPPSPQRKLTGVRVLSARGLVLCFRPRAHECEKLLLNQRRSMFHQMRGEQDCYLVCKFKSLETEATFTWVRTNFCADKNLHGSTLRSHGIGGT